MFHLHLAAIPHCNQSCIRFKIEFLYIISCCIHLQNRCKWQRTDCRGLMLIHGVSIRVTSGYISHLLIKPPIMEWLLLAASWCLFSQQHKKNSVLPWSLTRVSTSIPSVDCLCLFLSIWLSLVWYENPASSLFSWSRAIHSVCFLTSHL